MNRLLGAGAHASLALFTLGALGCDARLASDLSEHQANEVIVALHASGIAAQKEVVAGTRGEARYAVEVPNGEVGRALALLGAADLPRHDEGGIDEAFAEGGLVPTATEERARLLSALGGELARTIERIDGVVDARVHVALPPARETLLDESPPAPRASVLVKHRLDHAAPDVEAIRAIVAGAVHDLDATSVAVLVIAAEAPPVAPALSHVGPITVARRSASLLKGVLVASLGLHVLLASLLVVLLRRYPRPRRASPR
jgi:type III secretion protein J